VRRIEGDLEGKEKDEKIFAFWMRIAKKRKGKTSN